MILIRLTFYVSQMQYAMFGGLLAFSNVDKSSRVSTKSTAVRLMWHSGILPYCAAEEKENL